MAIQTRAVMRIRKNIEQRYILTGTPIANSPIDAFSQFFFLNPDILGKNFWAFRSMYCIMKTVKMGERSFKTIVAYQNLELLQKKIAKHSFRVLKEDCLDLPPKTFETIKITMDKDQERIYKEMANELITEFEGQVILARVMVTKLMRLSQITSGFVKDVDGVEHSLKKNPKMTELFNLLDDLLYGDKKVVIWTRFLHNMRMISEGLDERKIKYNTLHGGTKDKDAAWREFQADKSIKIFLGQYQTGGLGIDLFASDTCIFYDNSYALIDRLQSEDRLHRIGQDSNKVTYIDLICEKSIDEVVRKTLKNKKSLADVVTGDGWRQVLTIDESLHNK